MITPSLAEYGAGVSFGAALCASGVYSPDVISSQLALTNFHMIKSFMTASAASAVIMHVADRTNYAAMRIRNPQNLGFFTYDGNLVGGTMIGVGMALTGACPGTVMVQAGTGSFDSGAYALLGGIMGGLVYASTSPYLERIKNSRDMQSAVSELLDTRTVLLTTSTPGSPTIHASLNLNHTTMLIGWEAICLLILCLATIHDPNRGRSQLAGLISPIYGGLAIGAAQAAVILLTRHAVGCSKAYENVGRFLQCALKSGKINKSTIQHLVKPSTIFAAGIISAAFNLASLYPPLPSTILETPAIPVKALFGGAVMAYGASVAGGCTSGHGISGLVTFSFASFVSVTAMFGAGIATTFLMRSRES